MRTGGRTAIVAIALVLGFLITEQLIAEARLAREANIREGRLWSDLVAQAVGENSRLEARVEAARAALAGVPAVPLGRLRREAAGVDQAAGLTAVSGPGVVVELADANRPVFPGEPADDELIHDRYVLHVIAILNGAGARAIAVEGQRYVSLSAIFCAGPTIRINGIPYGSPFIIRAVGPSGRMLAALNRDPDLGGWSQLVRIVYRAAPHLHIPAYSLPLQFSQAKPAKIGRSLPQ